MARGTAPGTRLRKVRDTCLLAPALWVATQRKQERVVWLVALMVMIG
jgi:hypothetical protein